jgi:hypothetical protein
MDALFGIPRRTWLFVQARMFRRRLSRKLLAIVFCAVVSLPAAASGGQSARSQEAVKSNADKQQQVALIRARIRQCNEELSWNRAVQQRSDISEAQRIELQRRETVLTAEIANLQERERELR